MGPLLLLVSNERFGELGLLNDNVELSIRVAFIAKGQVRLTPVRPQQFSKIQLNDDGQLRPKFVS